jgi:hypothetical protein
MLWNITIFEDEDSPPRKTIIDVPFTRDRRDVYTVYAFAREKFGVSRDVLLCVPTPPEEQRN